MIRLLRILGLFMALLPLSPELLAAPEKSPVAVVEQFNQTLISVMKNADKLGYAGRYRQMESAIRKSHDLPAITRIVAGRHWDSLDNTQKELLTRIFSKLIIATYANRFDGYTGESFQFVSQQSHGDTRALVRCILHGNSGKKRQFDYLLRRNGDDWRIVNIIVDGVSDVALKRVEYGRIIKDQGLSILVTRLKEKIALYENSAD